MPITEKQKQSRIKHIGASESAAILGLTPWKTALDLWLEKTGKLETQEFKNEAAKIGNMAENGLLDYAAGTMHIKIIKNQFRVHEGGILSATHDALVVDKPEGLEAKTSGIMNPFAARDTWGEDGTDAVPEHVLIQCQQQALVSGLEVVHVPALIAGKGILMYHVERSSALCEIILERVTAFWIDNVRADIPPEGLPSLDVIRYRRREPGLKVTVPADLVQTWRMIADKKKEVETAENQAKAAVLAAMGDAEIGESEAGNVKITKSMRKGYTVEPSEVIRVTFQKAKLLKEGN
jgi:putative phage-type endonuclease